MLFLEFIAEQIATAVLNVFQHDASLLQMGAHEIAINHRIAVYLEKSLCAKSVIDEKNLSVDLEYNRRITDDMKTDNTQISVTYENCLGQLYQKLKNVRPDIIIHERTSNLNNILWLEIKLGTDPELCADDIRKAFYAYTQLDFRASCASLIDNVNKLLRLWIYGDASFIKYEYSIAENEIYLIFKEESCCLHPIHTYEYLKVTQ